MLQVIFIIQHYNVNIKWLLYCRYDIASHMSHQIIYCVRPLKVSTDFIIAFIVRDHNKRASARNIDLFREKFSILFSIIFQSLNEKKKFPVENFSIMKNYDHLNNNNANQILRTQWEKEVLALLSQ